MGDLGTFLYVNLHNVSFFQNSVRSWQMRYHIEALHCGSSFMCSSGTFDGCHGNDSQELIKNREKMLVFVICMIFKCDLSPINISKGISLFVKNFLALFLINSWQFYMIKIFWVWSTVLWKLQYCKCGVYPQYGLKWVILSDQRQIMANIVSY